MPFLLAIIDTPTSFVKRMLTVHVHIHVHVHVYALECTAESSHCHTLHSLLGKCNNLLVKYEYLHSDINMTVFVRSVSYSNKMKTMILVGVKLLFDLLY